MLKSKPPAPTAPNPKAPSPPKAKISSQNATKHGLSARVVVLDCEDHDLFDQLEQDYIDELRPHTTIELHLVQRVAAAEWRIRRAQGIATATRFVGLSHAKLTQLDRGHSGIDGAP